MNIRLFLYMIILALFICFKATADTPIDTSKTMSIGGKYLDHNGYENQPGILGMEFIYEKASFPECHASTIVETDDGLVAAWFGGTREGNRDVCIWLSRLTKNGWSHPIKVADGVESPERRYPCWNPVLFNPSDGPLMLFYKVGPTPSTWWGVLKTSTDGGITWSQAKRLPNGFLGPIKNKPIELDGNVLLCPSSTENKGWRVHFETYGYKTDTWEKSEPINDGKEFGAIQPTVMTLKDKTTGNKLLAYCRSRQEVITQTFSVDNGKTWSQMKSTELPNPNAGFDAVTLNNGTQLLVYNHTTKNTGDKRSREQLHVSVSEDGVNWNAALVLEDSRNAEFSYPAVIQTSDELIHITYTWKRKRIKHVVLDFDKLITTPIQNGKWPVKK